MPTLKLRALAAPLAAFALSLLLAACASGPAQMTSLGLRPADAAAADEVLTQAQGALTKGDLTSAFTLYAGILQHDKNHTEATLGLAETYLRAARYEEAHALFTRALPGNRPVALQGQGICLALMQRDDEALAALQAATALDKTLWRAWLALGQVYDRRETWPQAEAAYKEALALNPQSGEIYNSLGLSLLRQRRYGDSQAAFVQALERSPALLEAQGNLRLAYAWSGQYEKALNNSLPSERPQILNNIGYVAMERGEYGKAEVFFSAALRESPTFYKRASDNLAELKRRTQG